MQVSIILVSYNTKDMTRDCLNSIYKFTKDIEFEVFVVDNNSSDSSAEMIEQEFPQVRLIKNSDNKGFGAANNIAIKQSSAQYIFCLNTDTLLLNNSVKAFYDFMEKEDNKNVGACGGQLLNADRTFQHSGGNLPSLKRIVSTLFAFNLIVPKTYYNQFIAIKGENLETPYDIGFVTGADLFLRKSVLDKVGFYDETFFMYYEDSELQYRIKKAGFSSVIIPNINIIHYGAIPKTEIPIEKFKIMRQSELIYFEKCYNKFIKFLVKYLYLVRSILNIHFNKDYFEKIKMHLSLKY